MKEKDTKKRENEFYRFLNYLIKEYNLPETSFKKFIFLPFEKYLSEAIYSDKFIVYEDWWQRKPEIVKSKIKSILQISMRIHGRQCLLKKIKKPETDLFLEENHIFGTTNSKIKYGLFFHDELVGIATFAGLRKFRDGSRSGELLRFCIKNGYSVIGGLDKLLQAYIKAYKPDTLMTYINLDWGRGDAFINLGFEIKETKLPITFFVNTLTGERIPEKYFSDFENVTNYIKTKNKGSTKMVKKLK